MLKQFTKEERGWIMYDWANSAFSAIIAAIILPLFFKAQVVAAGLGDPEAVALWGYATTLATLLCAVLAPVLGALGDYPGYKKKLFTAFVVLGVICTFLLGLTGKWQLLFWLYILASLGFHGSCLYYDSFLNDVTTVERMDKVSTYGFSLGYIGGSTIPLVIAMLAIQFHDKIGISKTLATQLSFILTAVWWAVFTWPMLRHVQQKHSMPLQGKLIGQSIDRIRMTAKDIFRHRGVMWFLIAYFFYIDGVGTVISMATVFGSAKGLGDMDLMLVLMIVQLVAFPCAIVYGVLAKRFGTRNMIFVGIVTYLIVCLIGLNLNSLVDFIILGALVGTAQGGIQALSRSYFGKIIPSERSSEFFGFFDVFGKFSAVLGPMMFGVISQVTGRPEYGVVAVLLLFLVGGGIFMFLVPKEQKQIGA